MSSYHIHIERMGEIVQNCEGFDRIIVVTSNKNQAAFWQTRLDGVKDQIIGQNSKIYAVVEEWAAGQLLGTLNAFNEVCKEEDLDALLDGGGKVAIYHTAGLGKRMAPIVQSEGGDKSAIKLPGLLEYDGQKVPMRLLEAVIYQSSIFAPSRRGRICVFWTDQVFIPSGDVEFEGKHHVELLSIRREAPRTREDWDQNWRSYGLVIPNDEGAMMLEKQTWDEFTRLVDGGIIKPKDGKFLIAKGLGCFSISYKFFIEVLAEFRKDLEERGKLDTDPDLWMPLTSPQFVEPKKRARVEGLIDKFASGGLIFKDKDVGADTYWWDFGQVQLYHQNLLKLTEESEEGGVMRAFFRIWNGSSVVDSVIEDSDLAACVVISSRLKGVRARRSIIYNCIELSGFSAEKEVVADIFHPLKGKIRMRAGIFRDGKKDWNQRISPNSYTYEELECLMRDVSMDEMHKEKRVWENYFVLDLGAEFDRLKYSGIRFKENLVLKAWGYESWLCSAHPANPSMIVVRDLDIPLIHLLNHCGNSIIGKQIYSDFKGEFPILIKFINAAENLSVQVHPSDADAELLGEVERGKTESWYIIDAKPGAKIHLGLKAGVTDLFAITEEDMNAIEVKAKDLFLIPAGTLHAIGGGILLFEIQESSDITYRVWDCGRGRELHLEKAGAVCVFDQDPASLKPRPEQVNGEIELVDTVYFTLSLIESGEVKTRGSFHLLTAIEEDAVLEVDGRREALKKGDTVLIPASIPAYRIASRGKVLKSYLRTPAEIDPVIFQTYDVRAHESKLPDRVCYYLGKGYGTYLRRLKGAPEGELWVCIGGGIRLSTPRIRKSLIAGVLSSGVNVYDLGRTSTPEAYFSIPFLGADGGINITASHNPAFYNGLKQVIKSDDGFISSINRDEMLEIKRTILESDFLEGKGKSMKIEEGSIPSYHNILVESNCRLGREIWVHLIKNWDLRELLDTLSKVRFPGKADRKSLKAIKEKLRIPDELELPITAVDKPLAGLKVVIDFGNGSAWRTKEVYENLGCEVIGLNQKPDGNFPAHHPDPIKAKYRKELEETTFRVAAQEKEKEVLGFGHDEDGDRVIFVRSDGKVVEGDRTLAIQAKDIIEDYSTRWEKPRFIGEVKFSRVAEEFITASGGEYIMTPTGFAFIKERIKKECRGKRDVALAAELSGHQMAGHEENWMFDDGTMAACKLLSVIAKARSEGKTFIDLDEAVPRYPATPEINIKLPTSVLDEKEEVVRTALRRFEEMDFEIDYTDGGLIKWYDDEGWVGQALIRKSNTQPMIICRVEGRDEARKERVEAEFFGVLERISTDVVDKLDLESDDYLREWKRKR